MGKTRSPFHFYIMTFICSYEIFKDRSNINLISYVDAISLRLGNFGAVPGCAYVRVPYDLNSISKEVLREIAGGCSLVIFDSLSNLLAYGASVPARINLLGNFINSFLGELKKNNGSVVFLCKEEDKEMFLIEEAMPLFDEVV